MQKQTQIFLTTLLSALSSFSISYTAEIPASTNSDARTELQWTTQYKNALSEAQKNNKPLFLYFTGSDWCGWCKVMDKEILTAPEFVQLVGNKFIFVKIDFPLYSQIDSATQKQNEELKKEYEVTGFPTVIILSPQEKQIAILNYKQGGGKSYAEYLLKLLKDQEDFNKGMQSLSSLTLDQMKSLHEKAMQLGMSLESKNIIAAALQKGDSIYFLAEAYQDLAESGQSQSPESKLIRQKLLNMDPDNRLKVHYRVAVIDFEANTEDSSHQNDPFKMVQPLTQYLKDYGTNDPDNRWRIEMTISQVFRSQNLFDQALSFAKSSYDHAPEEFRNSVAQAVVGLQQSSADVGAAEK